MLLFKWLNCVICLAALATAGLGKSNCESFVVRDIANLYDWEGIYGSGLSIRNAFETAAATSFGCAAPV